MATKTFRNAIAFLLVWSPIVLVSTAHARQLQKTASMIRVAPPAPVFEPKARHAELAARRARVAELIGPKGVLVLFSTQTRVYSGEVNYQFRQENNLYYLTSLRQSGVTLVLMPGNKTTPEILFMRRPNPWLEMWNGRMYSAQDASEHSGITEIWDAREFEPFLQALRNHQTYRPDASKILMSFRANQTTEATGVQELFDAAAKNQAKLYLLNPTGRESYEYPSEQKFGAEWLKAPSGFSLANAAPIFTELRQRKSLMEIAFIQHAIDITSEAQQRAWAAASDAKWEYEIDALVAYTFRLRNADHWGFPSIVGCGVNTTTLHYDAVQSPCKPGDLLLMDIGAEYEHYSADVTRTVPVSGKFSTAQAEVYQIVFDAQEAAAKVIRPGIFVSDVDRAATQVIKDGLFKLGLITDRNSSQFRLYFMHNTTHWLGMNVHDVGSSGVRLEPGMVFTNEPGIYVRPNMLDSKQLPMSDADWEKFRVAVRPAFEKYKGIGVRIEDDMLVTENGTKWLSGNLPRSIADIETFIAKARAGN